MPRYTTVRSTVSIWRRWATAIVITTVATIAIPHVRAGAQNLAGSTLQPVENADSLIGDLIDKFVSGGSRTERPIVDRVVVVEDGPRRVVVTVAYSTFPAARLSAEVRDRRRPGPVRVDPVDVAPGAGEATLVLELQGSMPDDSTFESRYLRVVATDPQRGGLLVTRTFALPKKWAAVTSPQNVRLKVAPVPIGSTASLGDQPNYARPPKVAVPMRTPPGGVSVGPASGRPGVMTAPPPPVAPPPAGTVRDHRGGQTGGQPVVRDHRGEPASGQPVVRDHRGDQPASAGDAQATVRDHRGDASTIRDHRAQTAAETKPARQALPPRGAILNIDRFNFGVKPEDAQKGAQGPAPAPVELLEGLSIEDIDLNPAQLLSIASNIYPDKNPASGIFYYHPRAYHLEWSPESGLGMRILYGAATGSAGAGDVLMAARLQSGLDASEVQLARELLNAYQRRNRLPEVAALRALPLDKDGVDVSLSAVLGQYSIPKDKVAITGLSDVLGEIEVSWVTDPVTKENVQLALAQDVGVSGMVGFTAVGGTLAPQVPISIQLADRDSYGRLRWNRSEGLRNITPYPIRLRYLHALVIDPANVPILYSWSLGNAEVPPQGSVQWDASRVPAWIDTVAKRVWIDYSVVQTCDVCDRQVLDAITGGVSSVTSEQITFHTITPLADVGGYELTAQVRSKYFDPKDRTLMQKSVVLKADNQDFMVKPIYSGNAESGDHVFEYLLELAMPDGTVYRGTRWIPSDTLRVLVGRAQLEQSIGTLPGK